MIGDGRSSRPTPLVFSSACPHGKFPGDCGDCGDCLRARVAALERELAALRMVHQEARELVGEADATGVIPLANLDALRALLWRASIKAGKGR